VMGKHLPALSVHEETLTEGGSSPSRGPPLAAYFAMSCGKELDMIYYALVFLIVGIIAGILGLAGVASIATQIAWVLFLIGIVLLVIQLVRGSAPPVA
jgi:uncharacterized membrane protein YtjA (UPF0391 family)